MTGATFARGTCRALLKLLKWPALVGSVVVLGSGAAFAQTLDPMQGGGDGIELMVRPPSAAGRTEGNDIWLDVTLHASIPTSYTTAVMADVSLAVTSGPATLITASPQMLTVDAHTGNSLNTESWSDTTMFQLGTQNDVGGEDDTVVLTVTLGAPFSGTTDTITFELNDSDLQTYTLTRSASTVIRPGGEVTLEFKSTLPVETNKTYEVRTSDPTVATVTPLAPTVTAGDLVDETLTVAVLSTAINGDTAQIVVSEMGVGTGAASIIRADYVVRVGPSSTVPSALTFTPATQPDIMSGVVAGTAIAAMQLPTVTAGGTPPYMYTATGLPRGLMVAPLTGMLTGTPATAGAFPVTYTATDNATPPVTGNLPMFTITVAAAGTTPTPTGTPSARVLRSVTVGQLREGGQAQATVVLSGPVESGRIFKAKLRLVGQMNTRQSGIGVGTLASQPYRVVGGVRVPLTGELTNADYDANVIGEVTIQPGYSSGAVTIYTGTDPDAEDERLLLQAIKDPQTFMPNSDALPSGGKEKVFMVEDSHTQGYVLTSVPSKIYESGNFTTVSTLHFTPNYVRDDVPVIVTLTSSHAAYSALFTNGTSTMQLPLGGAGVEAWFQLVPERRNPPTPRACECDGDRMNDEVVVTATIGGEEVATTTVHVVDVHKLPSITVTAMTEDGAGPLMELAEGSTYKVKVEANRNQPSGEVTSETVTVSLALGDDSTAGAEDYRITPSSVSIVGGLNDQSKTFTLEVLAGDGDIGDETLMLDAMVKGGAVHGAVTEEKGMLSVTLMDTTTLNVEPRSDVEVQLAVATARNVADGPDDLWTYGDDDLSIMLGALFKLPADGFTTTADAMSADASVVTAEADDGIVTVTAMGMGTTTVTVTATTAASAAQISANIATVEFEIMVDELTLVLMFEGDMDMMNLVEGGEGAMVTVSANQMVAEDTMVMIMRDRSMSDADDTDFMVEPMELMISAGEMEATAMVTAVEDNMPEEMEALVLYAMAGDIQAMGEAKFYLWDEAVPALPIIAQLLLAGLLGIGGFRRYRRR